MNFGLVVLGLFCLVMYLVFEVILFQIANHVCRIPSASAIRTVGVVLVLRVVVYLINGSIGAVLYEIYRLASFPLWEAVVVQFLLALPVEMVVFSLIHAKMMNQKFGQGISVWFVINLIKSVLAVVILVMTAAFIWKQFA